MKTVEAYAAAIMEMITEDVDGNAVIGAQLATARSFTDLYDHVDANEYMIYAEVPFDPDDLEVMAFYAAVQDEVTRRLSGGDWADDEPSMSPREQALAHGTVLGQFEQHNPGCDFTEGRSTTCTCVM